MENPRPSTSSETAAALPTSGGWSAGVDSEEDEYFTQVVSQSTAEAPMITNHSKYSSF